MDIINYLNLLLHLCFPCSWLLLFPHSLFHQSQNYSTLWPTTNLGLATNSQSLLNNPYASICLSWFKWDLVPAAHRILLWLPYSNNFNINHNSHFSPNNLFKSKVFAFTSSLFRILQMIAQEIQCKIQTTYLHTRLSF